MSRIKRVLKAVEGEIWAIQPEKLEQLAEILVAKAETGAIPTAADIEAIEARQRSSIKAVGAVAVIPIFGTISRRMGMLDAMSGGSSIETFQESFRQALADDQVGSIALQVHSPGGSVYGVEEAFRMIYEARGKKRVVAIADQLMASAAYYLGAAAGELVVTPSAEAGSIGVYTIHFDWSKAFEAEGIKVTIIKAGEHKAEGNPYEPLDDDAQAHVQSIVNDYYRQFTTAVARGRGVSRKVVEEQFGKGRTFTSARLVELGMADRVATFEEVIEELRSGQAPTRSDGKIRGRAGTEGLGSLDDQAAASLREVVAAHPFEEFVDRAVMRVAVRLEAESRTEDIEEAGAGAAQGTAAQSIDTDVPDELASSAREESMSAVDAPARPGGAAITLEEAVQADRERGRKIREMCTPHSIDGATVDRWVNEGRSTEEVGVLVLDAIRTRDAERTDVHVGADREAERPFRNLGEQLLAVVLADQAGAQPDKRLLALNAAATGSGETVPSDGGFLLQPEFTAGILKRTYELGQVASRVRRRPIGANSNGLKVRAVDETSRATGSRYGGLQMYWADEGDTVTATKPKFRTMELSLHKLLGLWYVTDELLADYVALQAFGEDAFQEETTFMVENAIFRGTGAGQPLGILNSAALVSVAKESDQTADTIVAENVVKMRSRLHSRSLVTAVWFINQDAEPQLPLMTIGDQAAYVPPGGLRDSPFGSLLGRPVIPVEYAATVGDRGDICLFDLDQFLLIDKGEVQQAWSIHVRFLNDEQVFRITYRVDGQPAWNQPLTPFQGTNTQSPFVVLDARA